MFDELVIYKEILLINHNKNGSTFFRTAVKIFSVDPSYRMILPFSSVLYHPSPLS